MITDKKQLTCKEARDFDLVNYLSGLGYEPLKIIRRDYWYLSPLRTENTPSFKVNRKLNRWYDHGLGIGGNIIDFAIRFNNCSIGEFLQSLKGSTLIARHSTTAKFTSGENISLIKIVNVKSIHSLSLLRYLHDRNIPFVLAEKYCKEIEFQLYDRIHHSIGFVNDKGGYELRNSSFKSSSSPKGISTINNGSKEVAVFEGFFDFLSWLVIYNNQEAGSINFCILNSLSFFQIARPFLELHDKIYLYLDNDNAGQNCSSSAMSLSDRYFNQSELYNNYKDLNEWHILIGKRKNQ